MPGLRTVDIASRAGFAASGFQGAKHTTGGLIVGLLFTGCGIGFAIGGWTQVSSLHTSMGTAMTLVFLCVPAVIVILITLLGALILGTTLLECLTSHACWVDGGTLYHAASYAGWKRITSYRSADIVELGAGIHSRIAAPDAPSTEGDILYQIEVQTTRGRLHIPLLKSLREDEAKICLSALRADLSRPATAWSPRGLSAIPTSHPPDRTGVSP
ncbi:MAG: hypothetical protein H0W83_11530 [Planctomycetes bacterium]|nr:hypothetical protein [Planctomycetota bacterium]